LTIVDTPAKVFLLFNLGFRTAIHMPVVVEYCKILYIFFNFLYSFEFTIH